MKQFISIITLFVLSFAIFSCSSDDDSSNSVDANLIVGEWAMSEFTYNTGTTITLLGQTVTSEGSGVGSNFDYIVTFNADNTLVANGSYDITITGTADGQVIPTQTSSVSDVNTAGEWSLNGDQLMASGFTTAQVDSEFISGDQDESTSTITLLNENTLRIESDFADAIPVGTEFPEGVEFDIDGNAVITFTRVN